MPTYQTITVDITPGAKEKPVLNASQFDNGRPFAVALTWEGVPFTDAGDFDIEIHVKKPDGNIVTAEPDSVVNEVCVFLTTEQMCACHGINECEIVLFDNDIQIGTGNFILDVEKAPDEGGIQSASEIHNLTQQIADIVPEVLGDDYYNKTQTDALLANKADVSDLPDMTQYYDKSQTDTLLNAKADKSDTYTKAQVDTALAAKANTADLATVATSGDYDDLINKPVLPDMTQYYTKSEVDTLLDNQFPTFTASGDIASFTTALNKPLVSVTADPLAAIITRCGKNFVSNKIENANIESTGTIRLISNYNCFYCRVVAGVTYTITTTDVNLVYAFFDTLPDFDVASYDGTRTVTLLSNNTVTAPITGYLVFRSNDVSFTQAQVEIGNQATAYEAYNGQTVPVADATTLITLSGFNNVFADTGSVTVQYKYMSM